ncbi:MAG: hypothetical protein K2P20_02150 [Oscillospiraceae bacterium]|nr:hypothetical protein [Oscillospiraceae bacterium]
MKNLAAKRLFLLNMDGTIYLDEDLFPGTPPFLNAVKERGGRYLFLTNNYSKSVEAYVAKLERMGIPAKREDFLTSVDALVADLQARPPYGRATPSARRASGPSSGRRASPSRTVWRRTWTASSSASTRS